MKLAIVFKSTLIIFLIVNVQAGWFGWGSDEPEEEVKPEVKKEENLDEQKIKPRVHEHEHVIFNINFIYQTKNEGTKRFIP